MRVRESNKSVFLDQRHRDDGSDVDASPGITYLGLDNTAIRRTVINHKDAAGAQFGCDSFGNCTKDLQLNVR